MKNFILLLIGVCAAFTLTACSANVPSEQSSDASQGGENTGAAKVLVVYFSMPETADPSSMTEEEENSTVVIDGKVLGNTQHVAQIIQENTNADIFRIEPATPYPTDHDTLVAQARQEQDDEARPPLTGAVDNLADYDTVFLGYPNWWGDMPMILYTFLDTHDLAGKTIVPFNTHGGSGFADTIAVISRLQPNATVEENGFTIHRDNMDEAEVAVVEWLTTLGL